MVVGWVGGWVAGGGRGGFTIDIIVVIFHVTVGEVEGQDRDDEAVATQRANVPNARVGS